MKKLFGVLTLLLAVNFLAVAGGVAWLKSSGHLDRDRVLAIKAILFPPPETAEPTTQPDDSSATTQPVAQLAQLLAAQSGRPAGEQVQYIQQSFDAQLAQVDRRQRELNDLQRQIEIAKTQLSHDRGALDEQKNALAAREEEANKLADDKGFQDSLALYKSMTGKQVKTLFLSMDDTTVAQYLDAMEPRTAARIIKEFKTPEETQFVQKVMQRMRAAPAAVAQAPTTQG